MGWEDRPYYRDRGASFNPLSALLTGSVPFFTVFGIRVRVHSALILFILCELLLGWTAAYSLSNRLASMAILFGVILLHEFGHCFAARWVGGWADEILLWPLGGLAFPDTPPRPGARFCTAAGGPLVNVLICLIAGAAVYFLAGHAVVNFNPLASPIPPAHLHWKTPAFYLWWTFVISYLLLLLNLLPIYPLDGGRILQTLLWKFVGHYRSMLLSCLVGMAGSTVLAIVGLSMWNGATLMFLLLAGCLFYACYQERTILRESGGGEPWQSDEAEFAASLYHDPDAQRRRKTTRKAQRIARNHVREEAADRQRLDMILAKVSAQGLNSLYWRERRTLRIATERRRRHEMELKGLLDQ